MKIPAEINIVKSNDPRSYRQSSKKLLNLGFKPKYNIDDAINDISYNFKKGKIKESILNYNVKTMKKLKLDY